MGEKALLFNRIAAVYGLFFNRQVRGFRTMLEDVKGELDFSTYHSIIDIG